MEFKKVYQALKNGEKIKREHWLGYWIKEDNKIMMYCKDGNKVSLNDTEDIFFTFDNLIQDDWIIIKEDNENIKLEVNTFTFGEAIRKLKQGKKVARKGWNGKNQYIELATNISYKNTNNELINAEHDAIGNKAIAFIGTSGVQLGWLASQADMLSEDWCIVE